MSEIADDYTPAEDGLDYEPDTDDAAILAALDRHLADAVAEIRAAETAAADAYASLPWWRRRLVDYREWRWRRRFARRLRRGPYSTTR
ncbi:hypothetical protein AB0B28_08230 [Glycomyces sp. NPDC046736]|uniref:hypothetical protein n=1 Tax=Glycomyces sp. NPDC046736 TaxID=3155615 RepID=UPI0033DF651E